MQAPIKFILPAEFDFERLIDQWDRSYRILTAPWRTETVRIFDTFDWRLFNKSLVLFQSGKILSLRKLSASEILHRIPITSAPVFAWEFPDGKFKDRVAPVIGPRALLRLVEIESRSSIYNLLDPEGKTVLRLAHEVIRSTHSQDDLLLGEYVQLHPIKGYSRDAQTIARRLEGAGLLVQTEDDIYFKGLRAAGLNPGGYTSKVNLRLEADMRADAAAKVILRFLLQVMQINAAYIEKDLDSEFVHDFRVAVRRTRSALGQIQLVFPEKSTARFKKDFAFVGKLSNELRDLDVYLLKEEAYKAKIASVLRGDIVPLFDYLRRKRAEAFQKVVRALRSKSYQKIIKDWEAFLSKPAPKYPAAANAKTAVLPLARKRIYKKYRSVVKTGRRILAGGDDQMLHVLRIHCKKLRYLLEFFAGLFPPEKISRLIEHLKRLQDNLGNFNDLRVQEEYLLAVSKELSVNSGRSEKTLLAVGSLVGALNQERQRIKDAFAETFAEFASPAVNDLFQELFSAETGATP